MRKHPPGWLLVFVLALLAAVTPRGEAHAWGWPSPPLILDIKTYASPSGIWSLVVDPSDRHGAGRAMYRLSKAGRETWSGERPFTLWDARVSNEGVVVGYAYSDGERDWFKLGDFRIVAVEANGDVRWEHAFDRAWAGLVE